MLIIRLFALAITTSSLIACSGAADRPSKSGQVAAVVNGQELTIHQINSRLQQGQVAPGTDLATLRSGMLEGLINEELLVQKALDTNLDRDPAVMRRLDDARRMILARSYLERVTSGSSPTPLAVREFYDTHPGLFAERRRYRLSEVAVQAEPEAVKRYKAYFNRSDASLPGLLELLRRDGVETVATDVIRNAEDLPLGLVPEFAKMKVGDKAYYRTGNVLRFIKVDAITDEPVTFELAQPRISAFLRAESQKKAAERELAAVRKGAEISYRPGFSQPRATPPTSQNPTAPKKEGMRNQVAVQRGLEGLAE